MQNHISRRQLAIGAGLATLLSAMPAIARSKADATLAEILSRQFEEKLLLGPEMATFLGIDNGERAALRSRLSDHSAAGIAAMRRLNQQHLQELKSFPETGLTADQRLEREVAIFQIEAHAAVNAFDYHSDGLSAPGPYGPTQLATTYLDTVQFLRDAHPVNDQSDAEAFISRMGQLASVIDAGTVHVQRNAEAGIVAPRFVVEQTIAIVSGVRDQNPTEQSLVASIGAKTSALGLSGYAQRAQAIFTDEIRPALGRQVDALNAVLPRAGDEAGVGRLPNGREYYEAALRFQTTSNLSAEQVHRIGLDLVGSIRAQIDGLFDQSGVPAGPFKERVAALAERPGQQIANTDAGRAEIVDYLNGRIAAINERLPQAFGRLPTQPYQIQRLPLEMEDGVPGGLASPGSPDGSRPGIFYINLRDTSQWPRYMLPTLAYHEVAPGHLFESALQLGAQEVPLYRRSWFFSGYSEGWGLYAEQIADELGMYEDDPEGRIGYLLSHLFRAARLVVDTGQHVGGWSRERAIEYLYENSYATRSVAEGEIDRYIVMPGQACGYTIGHATITRLRDEAMRRPAYDQRKFHDYLLSGGALPAEVVERRMRAWFNN